MSVAVVTDSTAYLPPVLCVERDISVVPLHVLLGEQDGRDGIECGPAELTAALRAHRSVHTSRPTPAEFATVFAELLAAGASEVVSVHLSGALSGTWEAARTAAEQVDPSVVRVVDSRCTGMALGFAALAAAERAAEGATGAEVERAAAASAARSATMFYLPTLDYLRRGGRIGTAAALLGTALAVKPLLHIDDGRISALEKVRTSARALSRLLDLAVVAAGSAPVRIAVHHLDAADRAETLAAELRARLPQAHDCVIAEIGAVIGAHTGPGMLGVVVVPQRSAPACGE